VRSFDHLVGMGEEERLNWLPRSYMPWLATELYHVSSFRTDGPIRAGRGT
jgi:hypothetical protein